MNIEPDNLSAQENDAQTAHLKAFAEKSTPEELQELIDWAKQILKVKESDMSLAGKIAAVSSASFQTKRLKSFAKTTAIWSKKHTWDKRSGSNRFVIFSTLCFIGVVGFQGIGIAAFGSAIGLPVWVLFGTGAKFLTLLIEQFSTAQEKKRALPTDVAAA